MKCMNSQSNNTCRLIAAAITGALIFVLAGCGSGGDSAADNPSTNPPANAVNIKGITFDPATSAQTDGSLIAIPTASYTTVTHLESTPGPGVDPSAQTLWYNVSSTVASDLLFSTTALPCLKLTVVEMRPAGPGTTASYYFAKAVDGNTYLMKKVAAGFGRLEVSDVTGATGSLVVAAPKDPVVGSVCFYPMDPDFSNIEGVMATNDGRCRVAEINVTSPQGVTGCTRLQRFTRNTDLYVKPGVGVVYWTTIQSETHSHTRPGLVGPG